MFNDFNLILLSSNIVILLIFIYYYYLRKQWLIRSYIIGKILQLLFIFLFESKLFETGSAPAIILDVLPTIGMAFEIFAIISYNGIFSKKNALFLVVAASLFISAHILFNILGTNINLQVMSLSVAFFYFFGGFCLFKVKDSSKFRLVIGTMFIVYSLSHLVKFVFFELFPEPGLLSIPIEHQPYIPDLLPPYSSFQKPIIEIAFTDMYYFVTIIGGFGLLIILKEQDEIELAELNKKISSENYSLKRIDEEKNRFFSIIAHDLKGPIGTLANISDVLIEKKGDLSEKDYEEWISLINQSLTRTLTLLNNLLFWARSQSGNLKPRPEVIQIGKVFDDVIGLMRTVAENKKINLKNLCPDNLIVYADKDMLQTTIRNIISNAIKFTNENGEVIINVENTTPIIISIRDNGIGMSPQTVDELFNLDSKQSTLGTNQEEGTGLGLKLVQEFVAKNNGAIWVISKEKIGSTFFISLPST